MIKSVKDLLSELRQQNINLILNEEDNIEITASKGKIPSDLINEIKDQKNDIINYLKSIKKATNSGIKKAPEAENYVISSSQKSLWIVSQIEESSIAYNIPSVIKLDNIDNPAFLQKAIESVIDRHEILRTVFRQDENGEIKQIIQNRNESGFAIEHKDFRADPDSDLKIEAFIANDSLKAFDLANGPLLRVFLLQRANNSYVFYYILHHIITDGWSNEVLEREVLSFYEANLKGISPSLPQLYLQYKDYATWEQEQLASEGMKAHKEYWLENLSGELPVLNLPGNKTRPKVKTYNGRSLTTYISSQEVIALRKLVQPEGGSLFMGFLAVLKILLYKYTNEKDIVVGTVIAGREEQALQDQIGYYVKLLSLRNQLQENDSFLTFFRRLKENTLLGYKHQNYPFDQLVIDLNQRKDTSRNPIFDFTVDFHNIKTSHEGLTAINFDRIEDLGEYICKTDIEFHFHEIGDVICFNTIHNSDIYDQSIISQLMKHFKSLLQELLVAPEAKIDEVNYLSITEKQQLLIDFNNTGVDYPKDKTVIDLFEEQVKKSPDAIAVQDDQFLYSYQELDQLSDQIAAYLLAEYGPEDKSSIAIMLTRSSKLIAVLLGILKSGRSYIPLDPKFPVDRLNWIVSNSEVKLLISEKSIDVTLNEGKIDSILFLEEFLDKLPDTNTKKHTAIAANATAYIIYTSGSTGNPKGVEIGHRSLVNFLVSMATKPGISNEDTFFSVTTYSFDISILEFFLPLISGANLYVASHEILIDPVLIIEKMNALKPSIIQATPSFYQLLTESGWKGDPYLKVFCGGEPLSVSLIKKLKNSCKEIWNLYGPTETTIWSTVKKVETESSNIGTPINNTQIYILDNQLKLLPVGMPGLIFIGGDGLAKGYLKNEELTNERFIKNPFVDGALMYNTGDIGKWLANGTIDCLGRIDDQVKIRGHRIELEDIERNLHLQKGINKSVVIVSENEGDKFLVAYYVSDTVLDKKAIQSGLSKVLPDYMLPGYFIQLEALPLTPNGKVDKKALPEVQESDLIKEEYIAPQTPQEMVLATVWSGLLGYEKIGIKDSFYNLGGDSIKSILVISRLKQQGYVLKVDQILRNPVLEDLAKLMVSNTVTIDQSEVSGDVFLTSIQHHFFESDFISNKNHYNQSVVLVSAPEIASDLLEQSIVALVRHHDALRMVYTFENNSWKQYNKDTAEQQYKINFYDLRKEQDERAAMLEISEKLQSGFDISSGVLFQIGHFRLSDGDRLALIVHHLVIDGVSWRILLEDLSGLYNAYQLGKPFELPLKTDSFLHWSYLLQDFAKSRTMQKERKYWDEVSKKSIPLLPVDYNENQHVAKLNKEKSFVLDKRTTEILQTQVHHVYKTDINDILLTALSLAIQDVFKAEKSVVLIEGHGRQDIIDTVDISRTIGWFTSLYPFVLDITAAAGHELITVKDSLRKIPGKGIGYGILNHLDKKFDTPLLPSVQFNYLGDFGSNPISDTPNSLFSFSSESIGASVPEENTQSTILLDISGMIVSKELSMSVQYSGDRYADQTIEKFLNSYKDHLEKLIATVSNSDKSRLTSSDLTYKNLSFKELLVLDQDNNIEDIYELSPLQLGMYYYWLRDPSSPMYFEQMAYTLNGEELSIELVQQAFNELIARYSILRTAFSNNFGSQPLQIVYKKVAGHFSYEKIANTQEQTIEEHIEKVKAADKLEGFDFETPSLMRLKVLEIEKGRYVFLWSHHHILMDGWCISILINDFAALLEAIATNKKSNLPVPVKYSEYINWLSKIDKDLSLAYWKNYLKGLQSITDIPFKISKEKATTYNEKLETLFIDGTLFNKIANLCQEISVTPNIFIQAVWGYLLSRYNNVQDVVFGAVVSGRPGELSGVEDMIGLFINTIPVRLKYTNKDTPISLLKKLQADGIESNSHHYVNLSEIQSQSELGMDLIKSLVIFENYFVHENEVEVEEQEENKPRLLLEDLNVFEQTNYDFSLTIGISSVSLEVLFKYNSEVFKEDLIKNLVAHFASLVEQFSTQKDTLLQEIDYLTAQEKELLLVEFNNTQVDYPKDKTVVDLFEEQLAKTPDNIAIVFGDTKLTYKELDEQSNQLAAYLIENYAIKADDLVGIKLDRSERMIISIFGILKSGGAYVPIDVHYPQDRIDYIAKDAGFKVCIDENELGKFKLNQNLYKKTAIQLSQLNHLAYCIYTSGSTGKPKGVLNHHAGLYNRLFWMKEYLKADEHSVFLQKTPYTFDVSVWELILPFITGSSLVIARPEGHKDVAYLQEIIEKEQVTVLHFVPSMLSSFLEYTEKGQCGSLSHIVCSGEELTAATALDCKQKFSGAQLHNLYGPTEAAIDVTAIDLTHTDVIKHGVSIGKPIANTKIYIVNNTLQLQPYGVQGELIISGIQVAKGYLNLEEMTKDRFIKDPFREGYQAYRTGDIAQWQEDGSIAYLGRIDNQVKIRGHRIELGEIERNLALIEEVSHALVVVHENEGDKFLVAYYVATKILDKKEIKVALSKVLTDYMVPNYYVQLDVMPLTSSGKADRKALPAFSNNDLIKEEYVVARTEEEKLLVSVWSQVLKYDIISIKDSFYNLGGDSIKIIRIISLLKQQGYTLKVEQILNNPIVEDLAKLIKANTVSIDQSLVKGEVALTPIQSYFFENEAILNKNHYNQSVVLRSKARIDSAILEQSVAALVLHHDALRMVYKQENNSWLQYNEDTVEKHYKINFYDLQEESNQTEALHRIGDELQAGFDLGSGVLFQVGHFRLLEGDCLLLFVHHLVVDGVSWRILLEDFSNSYQAYQSGNDFKLPLKTDSFLRWSHLQKEFAKSDKMQKERAYWQEISKEVIPVLPVDFKDNRGVSKLDQQSSFVLDKLVTEKLKTKIHHVYNTEINDILLTALALSIREVFGVNKSVIKVEGHGREEIIDGIDIGRTIGWFTTIYPFVLALSDTDENELIAVKESLRKIPNKGIGYGILNYLDKRFENQLTLSILFNYLGDFGTQSNDGKEESIFELSAESIGSESDPANSQTDVLLDISGIMFSEELSMTIRYSGTLFKQETIDKLIASYQNQLTNLINELSVKQSNAAYQDHDREWQYGDMLETTPNQRRFLKLASSSVTVNFEISSFNEVTFQERFREFLSQFPALTVEFVADKDRLFQRYISADEVKINWLFLDVSSVKAEEIDAIGRTFLLSRFDVLNQELIRVFILQKEKNATVFVAVHHALADNYTGKILKKELISYFQESTGQKTDYYHPFTFASNQKEFLVSKPALEERKYWVEKLQDIVAPNHQIEIQNEEFDFVIQETIVSGTLFESIQKFSINFNLPLSALFNTFFEMILNDLDRTDKKIYRVLVDCREQEIKNLETSKVLGVIDNILPLTYSRFDFDAEAVRKCYTKYLEARLYQRIPYEIIREDLIKATQKDLDKSTIGYFNFLVEEGDLYIDHSGSQTKKYLDKNPDFKGINLTCNLHKNSITIKLVLENDFNTQNKEIDLNNALEKFIKLMNSTL